MFDWMLSFTYSNCQIQHVLMVSLLDAALLLPLAALRYKGKTVEVGGQANTTMNSDGWWLYFRACKNSLGPTKAVMT